MEYFQILWHQGVMRGVFSDFVASGRGEWWVEHFHILWLRGEVFSDFVASGRGE